MQGVKNERLEYRSGRRERQTGGVGVKLGANMQMDEEEHGEEGDIRQRWRWRRKNVCGGINNFRQGNARGITINFCLSLLCSPMGVHTPILYYPLPLH